MDEKSSDPHTAPSQQAVFRGEAVYIRGNVRTGLVTLLLFLPASTTAAQTTAGSPPQAPPVPEWSFRVAAATYIFKDDDNYIQPTITADRGALHLEARYNYEDMRSVSGFVGWNFAFERAVTVEVTPIFGAVVGDTDGIIPGVELTVSFRRLEFYSEGEYVIDLHRERRRFLYNWSELSVWATDWLRAGLVTQRTNTFFRPRDIQRGPLVGLAAGRFEGALYFFNPGSDDYYYVASIGMSF